jgi:CRISPR-associated protein Cas2
MLVMILEKVPPSLRGELTRWLIQPQSGVYVGDVSAMVRDKLWEKCCQGAKKGGVIQIWSTNTEQGYALRMHGITQRVVVDYDGVQLVRIPHTTPHQRESVADKGQPSESA